VGEGRGSAAEIALGDQAHERRIMQGQLGAKRGFVGRLADDDVVRFGSLGRQIQAALFCRMGHLNELGGEGQVGTHEDVHVLVSVADLLHTRDGSQSAAGVKTSLDTAGCPSSHGYCGEMKNLTLTISSIAAIVILVFAFIAGIYPHHDYVFSTFLVAWAFAVAWIGGVLSSRIP
jgi:hypothetical protein